MPELNPAPREPKNPKQQHLLEQLKQVEQFKKREEQEKAVKTKLTEIFSEAPALAKSIQETHALYLRHPERTDLLYSLCVQSLAALKNATEKTETEVGAKGLDLNTVENHLRKRLDKYERMIYGYDSTTTLFLTKQEIVTHSKGFADYYLDYEKALMRNKTLAACRQQQDALTAYAIQNAAALNELILYSFGKTAVFKYNAPQELEQALNQPSETTS